MELSRGDASGAARDLVAERNRRDQLAAGNPHRVAQRERRRHGRAAHVDDGLDMRVVVLEGLRQRTVGKRRHHHVHAVAGAEDARPARRRHRDGSIANRLAERRRRACERESDHVEDAQLGRAYDVGRQIVEREARRPLRELGCDRHPDRLHGSRRVSWIQRRSRCDRLTSDASTSYCPPPTWFPIS